jgi:hypothetical protein
MSGQIRQQNDSGKDSLFDLNMSKNNSNQITQDDYAEASEEEDETEINLETIEPYKFNWFKYLIDKHLQHKDEEGNVSALHSADSYINLLNIVISQKSNEEIQEDLLDLVGFHNFMLLEQLMSKREAIKVYCSALSEKLKEERNLSQNQYKGKNMTSGPLSSIGVQVVKQGPKKGKKKQTNIDQYENQKVSNYDLLKKLGFDEQLIEENKRLGLKEKPALGMRAYISEME